MCVHCQDNPLYDIQMHELGPSSAGACDLWRVPAILQPISAALGISGSSASNLEGESDSAEEQEETTGAAEEAKDGEEEAEERRTGQEWNTTFAVDGLSEEGRMSSASSELASAESDARGQSIKGLWM